jgi:hypothetical protein
VGETLLITIFEWPFSWLLLSGFLNALAIWALIRAIGRFRLRGARSSLLGMLHVVKWTALGALALLPLGYLGDARLETGHSLLLYTAITGTFLGLVFGFWRVGLHEEDWMFSRPGFWHAGPHAHLHWHTVHSFWSLFR